MNRDLSFGLFVVVALLMLVWPLYPLFAGDPAVRVLGVPLSMAWHVLWIVLTFGVLVWYEATREEP